MTVFTRHRQPRGTPILKSAREQLDILSAYHELGSFRAAAALCGTTHKTVRRVVERRSRPSTPRPPTTQEHRCVRRPDRRTCPGHRRPDQCQASADHLPGRRIWRLAAPLPAGCRRGQGELASSAPCLSALAAGSRRTPRHRLGHRGRHPRLLRGSRLEPGSVRPLRRPRGPGHDPGSAGRMLRDPRRRAGRGPGGSDGLPQGWRRRQRRRAGSGIRRPSPPTMAFDPTSARPRIPSPRAWSRTWSAMPRAIS